MTLLMLAADTTRKLLSTVVVAAVAVLLALALGYLAGRRRDDPYARRHVRRAVAITTALLAVLALAVVWQPFGGQIGLVIAFVTAGLAFALGEVVGAIAGWYNILLGRIYRVGDRIELGGVRGDVIEISPLRTKILEMGGGEESGGWVRGRQHTGRVVTVSNKATFTSPVFNYSALFEFIWEELTVPVAYDDDWERAEQILLEELQRISASEGAREALATMTRRYPVPQAELQPRVFMRATDNWMELAARFVVPVRTARSVKDDITRRVAARLREEKIEIASETVDATVRLEAPDNL
ncbi:MAG TPA: mechanosensitive ion channel domain-containing protein [Gaiellaceae bacterium]|nr:mechanosensitive ion channel domain-containing protein [Gaiellaceae bacterium]